MSIAVKKDHDQGSFYKGKLFQVSVYSFMGPGHYHHRWKPAGTQADTMLDKELRVLHLAGNRK